MATNETYGRIIFLNGTSSSGKTSTARELEKLLDGYQTVKIDDFLAAESAENSPLEIAVSAFHHYIRDLASQGRSLIVDHVLQEPWMAQECAKLLGDFDVVHVKVYRPLEMTEAIERYHRPERLGYSRYQLHRVHIGKIYDLEVDRSKLSAEEAAKRIVAHLQVHEKNVALTAQKFYSKAA